MIIPDTRPNGETDIAWYFTIQMVQLLKCAEMVCAVLQNMYTIKI